MTINLTDTTFIIPYKKDSDDRLDNLLYICEYLISNFDTNIIVLESYNNTITHSREILRQKIKSNNITYICVKNTYNFFHRMQYLNMMLNIVTTPVVVNYDVDIILPVESYVKARDYIIEGKYSFVTPFSNPPGVYLISDKKNFFTDNKINPNHTWLVHTTAGPGFAIFANIEAYKSIGKENENFKAYGPEDGERVFRIKNLGYNIGEINGPVYHLEHYRTSDSNPSNVHFANNVNECNKTSLMSEDSLINYYGGNFDIKQSPYFNTLCEYWKNWKNNRTTLTKYPEIKKIVTSNLIGKNGRLGNQIYQYVFLYIYAFLHQREVKIPFVKTSNPFVCFRLDDVFYINTSPIDESESFITKQERSYAFDNTLLENTDDNCVNIHGYTQSYKYFEGYEEYIRKLLIIKKDVVTHATNYLSNIKTLTNNNQIVAIHIRKTDADKISQCIPCIDSKIIDLFVPYFTQKYTNISFLVFSDDINWCKQEFKNYNLFYSDNTDVNDFAIMSMCDHIIIGTCSTYSWWASFINDDGIKEIFAPIPWFNPDSHMGGVHADVFSSEWKNWKSYDMVNFCLKI